MGRAKRRQQGHEATVTVQSKPGTPALPRGPADQPNDQAPHPLSRLGVRPTAPVKAFPTHSAPGRIQRGIRLPRGGSSVNASLIFPEAGVNAFGKQTGGWGQKEEARGRVPAPLVSSRLFRNLLALSLRWTCADPAMPEQAYRWWWYTVAGIGPCHSSSARTTARLGTDSTRCRWARCSPTDRCTALRPLLCGYTDSRQRRSARRRSARSTRCWRQGRWCTRQAHRLH